MKGTEKVRLFTALAALLPGDVIHDVAPIRKGNATARMHATDAAQMKRLRKQERNQRLAKGAK